MSEGYALKLFCSKQFKNYSTYILLYPISGAAALLRNDKQLKKYIIYRNIQCFETEGNDGNFWRGAL